jgi:hypothetical protein
MYKILAGRNLINQGTNCSTMSDWFNSTKDMKVAAYDPSVYIAHFGLIEPGQAVNLPAAERARMNRAMPGIITVPERL